MTAVVKRCPKCGRDFSLRDLLSDPNIKPIGMSFVEGDLSVSAYYFTHQRACCGTTFLVPLQIFTPLVEEPIPLITLGISSACGGHCNRVDDLAVCKHQCRNAPYRRFLLKVLLDPAARAPAPILGCSETP